MYIHAGKNSLLLREGFPTNGLNNTITVLQRWFSIK